MFRLTAVAMPRGMVIAKTGSNDHTFSMIVFFMGTPIIWRTGIL
ncbi:MAG: hypothetical protein ACOX0D_09330 [Sphaerochaeta sp.]